MNQEDDSGREGREEGDKTSLLSSLQSRSKSRMFLISNQDKSLALWLFVMVSITCVIFILASVYIVGKKSVARDPVASKTSLKLSIRKV